MTDSSFNHGGIRTAAGVLLVLAALAFSSCSDSSTGPGGGGGDPALATLSFTVDGTTSLTFSGTAAWPPAGNGVLAAMDTAGTTLQIAAYDQIAALKGGTAGPEPIFNFIVFEITDSAGIGPGSYPLTFAMAVGLNIAMSDIDSLAYVGTSGSLVLTSVTPEKVTGTFSGVALRLSDFEAISVSGGTLSTPYVKGLFDLDDTASAGGDFDISVLGDTTPVYTWSSGPANALSVFRSVSPTVPVWSIVTTGEDSIASPVTHGTIPGGAVVVTASEPVLTAGVRYRVVVTRTGGDYAWRDFTP